MTKLLDIDLLLHAIDAESPCGSDLEYDAEFLELERAARDDDDGGVVGTVAAGEGPDWRAVHKQSTALLSRTKDLRVVLVAAKAGLRLGGIAGFGNAVHGLRLLLERYWLDVHPRLGGEDDNRVLRINILRELCDHQGVLMALRGTPLVTLPGLGSFSLRDIEVASGKLDPAPGVAAPEMSSIDAAFANCPLQQLQDTTAALQSIREDLAQIEAFVNERIGEVQGLSLEPLTDQLARMRSELAVRAGARLSAAQVLDTGVAGIPGEFIQPGAGNTMRPALPKVDSVASRADITRLLDVICVYYEEHEPASPVPILLRRAKRMVSMNFLDLVRELAPGGMSELETIRGPQDV